MTINSFSTELENNSLLTITLSFSKMTVKLTQIFNHGDAGTKIGWFVARIVNELLIFECSIESL